ncbi:VOC family protein [Nonomuraea sp. NPDC048826]|uniref:VOC family protein n=1 Tax=Nonomuraea sp. NPDC048826 TaxID=3364347 RepID=UPI003715E34D
MTITAISSIVIDCADPAALAAFYAQAVGGKVTDADADWASVEGGPVGLTFQRVDGYQGPGWPGPGKHAHLDLRAADAESAVRELVALGATRPEFQPGDGWTVLLDPEGHPFCVSAG